MLTELLMEIEDVWIYYSTASMRDTCLSHLLKTYDIRWGITQYSNYISPWRVTSHRLMKIKLEEKK